MKHYYESVESAPNQPVKEYQVEEYLDLDLNRASLSVFDVFENKPNIYYNQLGPKESDVRQFIVYDPLQSTCQDKLIETWPLAFLRKIVIHLQDSIANMNRKHIDIPIGPSGLLYAIEDNLADFKYVASTFSAYRLTKVDVYKKEFSYKTMSGWDFLSVIVHVIPVSNESGNEGKSLDQVYGSSLPDEPKSTKTSMNVAMVGACLTGSSDDNDDDAGSDADSQEEKLHPMDLQLDDDTFCDRDKLLFTVHYGIVAEYSPGTLVGKSLEDFGPEAEYNFSLEPFMRPVGIGCWQWGDMRPSWQKSFTRAHTLKMFSAEYVTLYGAKGVSFVAYDNEKRLLRLDEGGRKNIYDLRQHRSYHIDEYDSPASELIESKRAVDANEKRTGCIVLEMREDLNVQYDIVSHLIGISLYNNVERYMGSRMLDHANYDVFEKEVAIGSFDKTLPTLLFTHGYPGSRSLENKRILITYYAQTVLELSGNNLSADYLDTPYVPRFIEVWEYDTVTKKKFLINRVNFLQFSWQLDVEPANDPHSQLPGPVSMRLFEMEPCYQSRASQAEFVIKFERSTNNKKINGATDDYDDGKVLATLRDNHYFYLERMHYLLIHQLHVPCLNLVSTKLKSLDSGDLIVTGRLVELRSSMVDLQTLGYVLSEDKDFLAMSEVSGDKRYSPNDCKLASIENLKSDLYAYCPALMICYQLKSGANQALKLARDETSLASQKIKSQEAAAAAENGIDQDICGVYSLKYTTTDTTKGERSALAEIEASLLRQAFWYKDDNLFKMLTDYYYGAEKAPKMPRVLYSLIVLAFKQLDSIGARLSNNAALMSGLRYSTVDEEPAARNLNTRVPVNTKMGAFRYCQLACQMDDFCGSFSVCSRRASSGSEDDCVLSSVRLTGSRLNKMMLASTKSKQADKFEFAVTSEYQSQKLIMYRDSSCSLHTKDFLSEYHIADKLEFKINASQVNDSKKPAQSERHLTLEDCASLSFEKNLIQDPAKTTFTYCPLNSHCIMSDDKKEYTSKYCFEYRRHSTRVYNLKPMTHMIAAKPHTQEGQTEPNKSPAAVLNPLDVVSSMEAKQLLAQKFWTTSEQKCARDCNLHKSKCLAFDSCRLKGQVLCILYSIRSPLIEQTAHLPLLKLESDNMAKYKVELVENTLCDHYYLKGDYFEVRLKSMLADEEKENARQQQQPNSSNNNNEERDKIINELEDKIISEDKQQSDEQLASLVIEMQQFKDDNSAENEARGLSNNQLIHFVSLLIGLFIGAVGILFKQQIASTVEHIYISYKTRSGHANDGLDQLVINDDNM